MKSRWDAGQFKLRGKKTRMLTCKCCTIEDFRDDYMDKQAEKEISELDEESIKFYGRPLTGKYKHFCIEFDFLPIDEHCEEFKYCMCFEDEEKTCS